MPAIGHARRGADVLRTVYFSALDSKGAPVTDVTATDLTVKEGGKDRAVAKVEAATAPLQISLLVDDGGSGGFQAAVAQFLDAMLGHAVFAIRAFNPQPSRLADFTGDVAALKNALNNIGPRGRIAGTGDQMIEAVGDAAKELLQRKAARPVIVVLTVGGEQAQSPLAEETLSALK